MPSSTPGKTNQEKNHAGAEEEHPPIVKLLDLLKLRLPLHVQLVVGGRVVKEAEKHQGNHGHDDSDIITPAPSCFGVEDERSSDDGSEDCDMLEQQ